MSPQPLGGELGRAQRPCGWFDLGVSRNYSQPTIKTLFGEARVCAYPNCQEPLSRLPAF
jgi:hypothetical protein